MLCLEKAWIRSLDVHQGQASMFPPLFFPSDEEIWKWLGSFFFCSRMFLFFFFCSEEIWRSLGFFCWMEFFMSMSFLVCRCDHTEVELPLIGWHQMKTDTLGASLYCILLVRMFLYVFRCNFCFWWYHLYVPFPKHFFVVLDRLLLAINLTRSQSYRCQNTGTLTLILNPNSISIALNSTPCFVSNSAIVFVMCTYHLLLFPLSLWHQFVKGSEMGHIWKEIDRSPE